jgi:non-heme chloroperoxidase
MPIQTKKIAMNGTELSYIEQGSGIPVVFVHGSLNDLRTWAFQMGPFSKFYHTIAISRRYHYPNDFTDDGWDYSALNHAEDMATFIEELGLVPAHVVGHSYGAYASTILIARYPELIRASVLCEPPIIPLLGAVQEENPLHLIHGPDLEARARSISKGRFRKGCERIHRWNIGRGLL